MIGKALAHFEITAKLREGGMGEVYRATDTKLGREVALKVLPAAMSSDPEWLERFHRGRTGDAARRLADFKNMADSPFVRLVHWAMLQLTRGELEEGFAWYEKSLDARDSLVPWLPDPLPCATLQPPRPRSAE